MELQKCKFGSGFVSDGPSVWQEQKLEPSSCKDGIKVNYGSYSNGEVNFDNGSHSNGKLGSDLCWMYHTYRFVHSMLCIVTFFGFLWLHLGTYAGG